MNKKAYYELLSDKGQRFKKNKKVKGGTKCSQSSAVVLEDVLPSGSRGGKCIDKDTLDKHFHYFYALWKGLKQKQQRDALIDVITPGQMACIKKVINTFLQGKVDLPEEELKKLKRDKKFLYSVVSPKTTDVIKKKVLKMKGGAIMLPLLGALLPGLLEPVAKAVIAPVAKEIFKL